MPTKRYSKDRRSCQVTFALPTEVAAGSVYLCGDFNAWSPTSHAMKRGKDGAFKLALRLPAGQSYRYRFLLDADRWENDWNADRYLANDFGSEDSVVEL